MDWINHIASEPGIYLASLASMMVLIGGVARAVLKPMPPPPTIMPPVPYKARPHSQSAALTQPSNLISNVRWPING